MKEMVRNIDEGIVGKIGQGISDEFMSKIDKKYDKLSSLSFMIQNQDKFTNSINLSQPSAFHKGPSLRIFKFILREIDNVLIKV